MNILPDLAHIRDVMVMLAACFGLVVCRGVIGQPGPGASSALHTYQATALTPQDQTDCIVYGINSQGQVVGAAVTAGSGRSYTACSFENGQIHEYGAGRSSNAISINSEGEAVGEAHSHAALFSGGRIQDLGTLGGRWSRAKAINEKGWVVGESATADGHSLAFLYKDGKMHSLGSLGGGYSVAYSVNNKGQIVGKSKDAAGDEFAFLYSEGKMQSLGSLAGNIRPGTGGMMGEDESVANSINDAGQIVGYSLTGVLVEPAPGLSAVQQTHAFLWSNGKMSDLGSSKSKFSQATGINNRGLVVGEEDGKAVLWQLRTVQDLSRKVTSRPSNLTAASCIDDIGDIVAQASLSGHNRYYLLKPNPSHTVTSGVLHTKAISTGTASAEATIVLIQSKLFALQTGVKTPVWSFSDKQRSVLSFVETDKYVIAGTREGQIIVLDAQSGKVLHTTTTEGETRPVLVAGNFVVGTISGLFNEIVDPNFCYDLSKWKVAWQGGHANPETQQIHDGVLYGSDSPGFSLQALDTGRLIDGTLAGTQANKAYLLGDLPYYLFQPHKVVIGAGEDNVVELHSLDGARKSDDPVWTHNVGNPVLDVLGEGSHVFVLHGAVRPFSSNELHATPLTQITALDANTGKPIWNATLQDDPAGNNAVPPYLRAERLLLTKGILLTATVNQYSVDDSLENYTREAWGRDPARASFFILCIDAETGKEKWRSPTNGYEGIAAIDQSVVLVRASIDLLAKLKEHEASYASIRPPKLVKVQEQTSALDILTGKRLWQQPGYSYLASRTTGEVLLFNGTDEVIEIDAHSGGELQRYSVAP